MRRTPFPPIPAEWTVVARRAKRATSDLWQFIGGWDQVTVNALRDAGDITTAQRREADGSVVLVAIGARSRASRCGPMRRGMADTARDQIRMGACR